MENTPLFGAVHGMMSIVEASPELLHRPTFLRQTGMQILYSAAQADPRAADPFRTLVQTRADLARVRSELHDETTKQLIASPHIRALQVRFFAAWRHNCSEERYREIGPTHVRRPGIIDDFLHLAMSLRVAQAQVSDEERIRALCNAFHRVAESHYKELLRALVRIEWGGDDLGKIDNTVGKLIHKLRRHPAWRESSTLLSLVDPETAVLRNAIAPASASTRPAP